MNPFDVVRSAPPPKTIPKRTATKQDVGVQTDWNPTLPAKIEASDDGDEIGARQSSVRRDGLMTSTTGNIVNSNTNNISIDGDENAGENDQPQPMPLKTKAQQKMFTSLLLNSNHQQQNVKPFVVRIKRMTQAQVDATTAPSSQKKAKKRRRVRKIAQKRKSKGKKTKNASNESSIQLGQVKKPPPNLIRSAEIIRPPVATEEMGRDYGNLVCNFKVKIKRIKGTTSSLPKRTNTKCVSFNEDVEIIGSKPREFPSTSGGVKGQGNVNLKKKRSSSKGGMSSKLKRHLPKSVPDTGLARLHTYDSDEEPDIIELGDENIVPNDVSDNMANVERGARTVKRFSSTITVSDEDEDTEESGKPAAKMRKSLSTEPNSSTNKLKSTIGMKLSAIEIGKSTDQKGKPHQSELKTHPVEPVPTIVDPEPRPQLRMPAIVPGDIEVREDSPFALAIIEDVTSSDDILETHTSDKDVCDLYTPSSRQTTPELLLRFESPSSDSSFKSANETVRHPRELHIDDRIPSLASPLRQISTPSTPSNDVTPPAAPNIYNSSASCSPVSDNIDSTTNATTTTNTIMTTDTNTTTTTMVPMTNNNNNNNINRLSDW